MVMSVARAVSRESLLDNLPSNVLLRFVVNRTSGHLLWPVWEMGDLMIGWNLVGCEEWYASRTL